MIALLLIASIASSMPDRLDFQWMTSPAYATFAKRGDTMCPARKLRYLHPADLDGLEEMFLPTLPRSTQRRIATTARRATRACTGEGASCPAQKTLAAIVATRRLGEFIRYACAATV